MPRIAWHGFYGGGDCDVFRTGGGGSPLVAERPRDDFVLRGLVLCAAGQPTSESNTTGRGVGEMRVERERELRRRRKRRQKARKEHRKAALMKAGKWPLIPTKV